MTLKEYLNKKNNDSTFKVFHNETVGTIILSNSGIRGSVKQFTLGLDSIYTTISDILINFTTFSSNKRYEEKPWRDLGSKYFTDESAKALSTVQTKPLFATLSKIISWANFPQMEGSNTEDYIEISPEPLQNTLNVLQQLIKQYTPKSPQVLQNLFSQANHNNIQQGKFEYKDFLQSCSDSNYTIDDKLCVRFISSILTKPFVILTGLSGSGKTKLAQAFVYWIKQDDTQYEIVPVGADWTNREPLLGYPNALNPNEYVKPDSGVLDLIIRANDNPELPYFLILDEMNLSHVERYFADFLSAMESKEAIPLYNEGTVENGVPATIKLPKNLFFIGTVNIDETTNMFSPKVLDRANTIEFRVDEIEIEDFLKSIKEIDMSILESGGAGMSKSFLEMAANKSIELKEKETINITLVQFFGELKKVGAEFGYRTANEISILISQLSRLDTELKTNDLLDIAIMQKLLPKLHGSRRKLTPVLETLGSFCVKEGIDPAKVIFSDKNYNFGSDDVIFKLSMEKIARMYWGVVDNGFASFAEA